MEELIDVEKEQSVIEIHDAPAVCEVEHEKVDVHISDVEPEVIVEKQKPKITIIFEDSDTPAAIDAEAAAKEARKAADEARVSAAFAVEQAAYAKEMSDLAKEVLDGRVLHEITEEEANQIMDEIDNDGNN